jgi:HSP20 family protein
MSNIVVRREVNPKEAIPMSPPADLFLRPLRDFFLDPFERLNFAPLNTFRNFSFFPDFEVKETTAGYIFKADVPGVKEPDLEVTITGNRLTLTGKREQEKEERGATYYTCERSYGSFTRSFTLPEDADAQHVQAELKVGVLTVSVPKSPEAMPKTVPIKATEQAAKA